MLKADGKLIQALGRLADLIVINLLAILCCIPIITIGASFTAAYACMFRLKENKESYLVRDFFCAFRKNFRQATLIWATFLLLTFLIFQDYRILGGIKGISAVAQIFILAIGIVLFIVLCYALPMQAYFINPVKQTIRNAFLTAIARLYITIPVLGLCVLPFVIVFCVPVLSGLYLLLGITGTGWINCLLLHKIFTDIPIKE